MFNLSSPVICVVGPTASGKTALAQQLALSLTGEVVSADSMQIYAGMDIGTGKLSPNERLVPHFGFDILEPGKPFSASLFQKYARDCFTDIDARGKRVVLCGGTGFYVRAAIDDYHFPQGEILDNPIRDHYENLSSRIGYGGLWNELKEKDPLSAKIIPPRDVKRVIRALELLEEGKSYANQREKLASLPQHVPALLVGLQVNPEILRNRIDRRVDLMIEQGLVDEVSRLLRNGFREGITAPQAIGYKEIVAALDGECSLDEAVVKIKISTHRYAKRQRTWFRKDSRIKWINADSLDLDLITEQALNIVS